MAPAEADATVFNLNTSVVNVKLEREPEFAQLTHFEMGYQVEFTGTQHCTSMAQPL